MADLIDFYGTECPHCIEMEPLVKKLEKELKVKVERKEIWHNSKNKAEFDKIAQGKCAGVPFFFNKKTNKWICGEASYVDLKKRAKGE